VVTRIGLVGAGSVGQRHAKVLATFEDVELTAVTDLDERLCDTVARRHRARSYPSLEQMLAAEALDAAYVCVPPFAHGEPERELLAARLPFFVEKPLAVDLATAAAIAREVRGAGVITAAGYHWRYLDTVEWAAAQLEEHPPRLAIGAWLDKVPPPAWWLDRTRSGGQTVEQTTHVLDLMRVLVGEVQEVYAAGARSPREAYPDATVDDVCVATLRFEGGALGSLAATSLLSAKHRAGIELFAEGLALALTEVDVALDRGDGASVTPAAVDAKRQVDRDFVNAVQGGENRIRAPYEEALATHRLGCALALSAERGEPVAPAGIEIHV
jgi:predicted dehydrogenase